MEAPLHPVQPILAPNGARATDLENSLTIAEGVPPPTDPPNPDADPTLPEVLLDEEFLQQGAEEGEEELRRLRQERQSRRDTLAPHRKRVDELPHGLVTGDTTTPRFELPCRPTVIMEILDYSKDLENKPNAISGRSRARQEVPFLFKAFEQGQTPPPRPGSKKAKDHIPRAFTIHEYLDWTVTASEPANPDCLDFTGFRVVVLLPRWVRAWPPPGLNDQGPEPKYPEIGAPKPAVPTITSHNKPICAATIRIGPTWMEIPFYATQDGKRNRGYGRALLEGLEDLCRWMKIPRLLLCSTDDPKVKGTWQRLGLSFTTPEDLKKWGVTPHDLLHMDNTVQMYKEIGPKPIYKSVMIKHGDYRQRAYYVPGTGRSPLKMKRGMSGGMLTAAKKPAKKPSERRRRR